jgi:hypothetical protein
MTEPPNLREVNCCGICTRSEWLLTPNCRKFMKETYASQVCDEFEVIPDG